MSTLTSVLPSEKPSTAGRAASWVLQIGIAGLFVFFATQKLAYAPMTEVIFGDIGGRPAATASAILELAAAALLVVPRLIPIGALLALGSMVGAIGTHLAVIGIALTDPQTGESDGGALFGMAIGVFVASGAVLVFRRRTLRRLLPQKLRPAAA